MSSTTKRRVVLPIAIVVLLAFSLWFILSYGVASIHRVPGWTLSAAMMKLSLAPDPSAGAYYERTKQRLPLSTIVRELNASWRGGNLAAIHEAALEVGTALLHRSDVQMGEIVDEKFVPLTYSPWHANQKMISEVRSLRSLLANDRIYVFTRE